MLKHEDVSKLEELSWIEYKVPIRILCYQMPQLSIEVDSIDMVYFRFYLFRLISLQNK